MTTRTRVSFLCAECGSEAPKWLGRCPECGGWDTLAPATPASRPASNGGSPLSLALVPVPTGGAVPSGVGELDRVLEGGLVAGSVTLIGGEPGIGKSTLVIQALAGLAEAGRRCLLVTAEESASQVSERAVRVGANAPGVSVLAESSLAAVLATIDSHAPDVVAIDSIQAVSDLDLGGAAGSVSQVRECAAQLVALAKQRDLAVILVGHVTKDGDLAGPRALEHMVDTVISFEGDRHHALRLVRALKHRFGSTAETGVLEMTGGGLVDVADPSELFLCDRAVSTPGSVVAAVLEGSRPLLVEVQALVTDPTPPVPRRSAQGLESKRLGLVLAVLSERAGVKIGGRDVYASVAGGLRVAEPGIDLALALALASAAKARTIAPGFCAVGEIGLGGELRQVSHAARRLSEAARLGFAQALVPERTPDVDGIELVRIATVGEAVAITGVL